MHQPESSPLARSLQHVARRGYRNRVIAGVTLVLLLPLVWIYLPPSALVIVHSDEFSWEKHAHADDLIPPKIWQLFLPKSVDSQAIDPETLRDTASWLAMNPDYKYTLVGHTGGKDFVEHHFGSDSIVSETYDSIPNVGMKSDLLRYLILDIEGGVYTDTDTSALKPIHAWVPRHLLDKVRLIVGIEFDRRDGGAWADIPHRVQFCQWTIAAAPGHPVFRKMVTRVIDSLNELSEAQELPIGQLQPSSFQVMNSTGPAAWTDVVFAQLQEYDSSLHVLADLSFMTEPKLYGDILVLTIDGFGMGQSHSHSTHDDSTPEAALVKHHFRGSWRGS